MGEDSSTTNLRADAFDERPAENRATTRRIRTALPPRSDDKPARRGTTNGRYSIVNPEARKAR